MDCGGICCCVMWIEDADFADQVGIVQTESQVALIWYCGIPFSVLMKPLGGTMAWKTFLTQSALKLTTFINLENPKLLI